MRYLDLQEGKVEFAHFGNKKVKVYINPRGDWLADTPVERRFIIDNGDLYVWNSYEATHGQMSLALGILDDIAGIYNYNNKESLIDISYLHRDLIRQIFDKLNIPIKLFANESIEFVEIYDKKIKVFKNPAYSQIKNIPELRWIIDGKYIYLWDADDATHYQVADQLGLEHISRPLGTYNTKNSYIFSYGDHRDDNHSTLVGIKNSVFKQEILDIFQKYKYPIGNLKKRLKEAVEFVEIYNRKIKVFKNPTYSQIKNMGQLRWIIDGTSIYMWNANDAIHYHITEQLGLDYTSVPIGFYNPSTTEVAVVYEEGEDEEETVELNRYPDKQTIVNVFQKYKYPIGNLEKPLEEGVEYIDVKYKKSEPEFTVMVFVNPLYDRIKNFKELRWFIDDIGNVYFWDSEKAIHYSVMNYYGFAQSLLYGLYFPKDNMLFMYNREEPQFNRALDIFNQKGYKVLKTDLEESVKIVGKIKIFVNPNKEEQLSMIESQDNFRFLYDKEKDNLYIWNSYLDTHNSIIKKFIAVEVYPREIIDSFDYRYLEDKFVQGYIDLYRPPNSEKMYYVSKHEDNDLYDQPIKEKLRYFDFGNSDYVVESSENIELQHIKFKLYVNPTKQEITVLKKIQELRYLYDANRDKIYVWDSYFATHYDIQQHIRHVNNNWESLLDSRGIIDNKQKIIWGENPDILQTINTRLTLGYEVR